METLAGSPLTLVVKAPNQEVGDQTVECFLDWTVRKLKKHLSAVYPTNPVSIDLRVRVVNNGFTTCMNSFKSSCRC